MKYLEKNTGFSEEDPDKKKIMFYLEKIVYAVSFTFVKKNNKD